MPTLKIAANGHMTLREDMLPDGRNIAAAACPKGDIAAVFNALRSPDRAPMPIKAMDAIAVDGWTGRR